MLLIKGLALGFTMFFAFSVAYWIAWFGAPTGTIAIDKMALDSIIVHNYLFWAAGILMLVLGCVIMYIWPVRVSP